MGHICFVHVKQEGKIAYGPKYIVTDQLGDDLFDDCDARHLYWLVSQYFPTNDWDDINLDDVKYDEEDGHVDLYVRTWSNWL